MKDRPPLRTRFPWCRWIRRFLYGLTICVAWKLAVRWYEHHTATREYEKAGAELDKSDRGWRWEEIEAARKAVPTDENGAARVLAAAKLLPKDWPSKPVAALLPLVADFSLSSPPGDVGTPTLSDRLREADPNYQLSEDVAGELRAELTALEGPLATACSVSELSSGRYASVTLARNPINTLVPHLVNVRTVTTLLHFDAALRAQDETGDAAANSILAQLNAIRSVGDEPFLLASIVRARAPLTSVEGFERVLGQGELSPGVRQRVTLALQREETESLATLRNGLRGERAMHDVALQRLADGELVLDEFADLGSRKKPSLYDRLVSWYVARPLAAANRVMVLRHMTEIIEFAQLPRGRRSRRVAEIEADLLSKKGDPKYTFYTLLAPAITRVLDVHDRQLASIRCARTALAAERFRMAHQGKWPKQIADLAPDFLTEVPIDPFTDDPLEMDYRDGVLIVSSVGPDAVHEGAFVNPGQMKPPDPVIRFRLWRPESRGLPSD